MLRSISAALAALTLAACATYEPVPKGYTGPVAVIRDTGFAEGATKAQLFALMSIDDNRINNAFRESYRASHNQGPVLTVVTLDRPVPVRPMKLALRGSHATGAPIHEMASRALGTFFSVEGEVSFTPEPDGDYVVQGELKKEGSSVWLADAKTLKPVSNIVTERK